MIRTTIIGCILLLFYQQGISQIQPGTNDELLQQLLSDKDRKLDQILNDPSRYQFQLIYVRVKENKQGRVELEKHSLFEDKYYFNPASLIKLPLAVVALEKLSNLKKSGIDLNTPMSINTCSCDFDTDDYVKKSKNPSLGQFLREMMIMSDNDAYNLYYDFTGKDYFNTRMQELGYKNIIMRKHFTSRCTDEENNITGGIDFMHEGESFFHLPCDTSHQIFTTDSSLPVKAGTSFLENGWVITGAKDFSNGNYVRLSEVTDLMIRLFFPDDNSNPKLQMDEQNRKFLLDAMDDYPRDLKNYAISTEKKPDNLYRYFMDEEKLSEDMHVYNKVGQSGGFISDVSYIEDKKNHIRFFLSASMLAKKSNVINDGNNNYKDFGFPVFSEIFQQIYKFELEEASKKK